jgi:hypothetical protein
MKPSMIKFLTHLFIEAFRYAQAQGNEKSEVPDLRPVSFLTVKIIFR